MSRDDTTKLLKECDAGAKMAVSTINEVLERVKDEELKDLLTRSRNQHEKLGGEIHSCLDRQESEEKDPALMAKGMSWLKTNMKLSMDDSDEAVAGLVTDGCNMGIKSLHKYLNQYADAEENAKELCKKLTGMEEKLLDDLQSYL